MARERDAPWRRLAWTLPAALTVTAAALAAFIFLLAGARTPPPAEKPVQMRIVELPPDAPPAPSRPPAPPPPRAEDVTPPPPPPEISPPEVSPPEPQAPPEAKPDIKSPPPRHVAHPRPRSAPRPAPAPTAEAARPSASASAPAPAPAPAPIAPGGGTLSARAIYQPKPEIPDELRHRKLALTALARFHVAADGSAQVELIQATPDPLLNRSIVETLKKWRFFPAMAQGKPVASDIDINIPISVE